MIRRIRKISLTAVLGIIALPGLLSIAAAADDARPRARDIGVVVGIFPTGENNAITDVEGVRVGHTTII